MNGILLDSLAMYFEGKRAQSRSLVSYSTRLQNMQEVLNIFSKASRGLMSKYLSCAEEILSGRHDVIWNLLADIRDWYVFELRKPARPPSPQPRAKLQQKQVSFAVHTSKRVNNQNFVSTSSSAPLRKFQRKITPSRQEEIIEWLSTMGLTFPNQKKRTSLLDDPLRNGVFLCDVVDVLLRGMVPGMKRNVKTINDAIRNTTLALADLRNSPLDICPDLLTNAEAYVQCSENLWPLFDQLINDQQPEEFTPAHLSYLHARESMEREERKKELAAVEARGREHMRIEVNVLNLFFKQLFLYLI